MDSRWPPNSWKEIYPLVKHVGLGSTYPCLEAYR